MPNWRDEYLSSLRESELNSPVNMELVQACVYSALFILLQTEI
jgi:hypothetical protein